MKMFTLLTTIKEASPSEVTLALGAFDYFMDQLTPKHRKRVQYFIITNNNVTLNAWQDQINLIKPNELTSALVEEIDLFICPKPTLHTNELKSIMRLGLPILALSSINPILSIPKTSMILIQDTLSEQQIRTYAHFMNMLYFDPEARKVLAKAAKQVAGKFRSKPAKKFSTTAG